VRQSAVRGLARLPAGDAEALLAVAFEDPNALVRLEAIEVAGRVGARGRAEALVALLAHPDARTAAAAVRALGRMEWLTPELLARAAAHADAEVVKDALVAGAHLPGMEALAGQLLAHPRWDVRAAAARLLTSRAAPATLAPATLAAVEAALARETDGLVRGVLEEARLRLGQG
jgi:HEAT repeat protein